MTKNNEKTKTNVFSLIKSSIQNLYSHQEILFPFAIICLFQLLFLEIIYFLPRKPLILFFGPVISAFWSENFLHYPLYFYLLPKLFQLSLFFLFIFVSNYFIGVAIAVIAKVNSGKSVNFNNVFKETFSSYVHILVAATITFIFMILFFKGYDVIFKRALQIQSTSGKFFMLKQIVILGAPYFNLLFSVFLTTIFAYVLPMIVIDKKKVFAAIILNIKEVLRSPIITFVIVLIPTLFYVPILILRTNWDVMSFSPELSVLLLILGILVSIVVDAVVYTALTTRYLLKQEG